MAEKKRFLLRLDAEVWAQLEAWAADELRSVNGQIEYLIREALRERGRQEGSGAAGEAEPGKPPGNAPES